MATSWPTERAATHLEQLSVRPVLLAWAMSIIWAMEVEIKASAAASERLAAASGYSLGSGSTEGMDEGSVKFKGKVMFRIGSKMAG